MSLFIVLKNEIVLSYALPYTTVLVVSRSFSYRHHCWVRKQCNGKRATNTTQLRLGSSHEFPHPLVPGGLLSGLPAGRRSPRWPDCLSGNLLAPSRRRPPHSPSARRSGRLHRRPRPARAGPSVVLVTARPCLGIERVATNPPGAA